MMVSGEACRHKSVIRPILFAALLIGFIGIARYFHLEYYVEKERLNQLIATYGIWAPFAYLVIWTIAPSLMIPATAIVVAGGIIFGPFWGEIYVIFGATLGATVSFLIARYLARDWLADKLSGTRLMSLDQVVASKGWKIVAISRLIPIFPFSLVNYAFGLTNVSFSVFVLATFLGMIPLTTAYVYLSSNFIDILLGKINLSNIFTVILVASIVIIFPFILKITKDENTNVVQDDALGIRGMRLDQAPGDNIIQPPG